MSINRPLLKRRKFLQTGSAWMLGLALAGRPAMARAADGAPELFDITFYQIGDPQYQALDTTLTGGVKVNNIIRENLKLMMALKPETAMPGGFGTVGKPRGVINVGDCTQSGNEGSLGLAGTHLKQWENYAKDFGLTGKEKDALINIPVYEGFGNRDQDGFFQQIIDKISLRNKSRPGVVAVSERYDYPTGKGGFNGVYAEGLHYAWMWGPIHFIHVNMRVGDSTMRYPSAGSHTFLENYLDKKIGFSGAPVIICMHLPPSIKQEAEWPLEDRQKFYDLIIGYNIVAIFCGNTTTFGTEVWSGPDQKGSMPIRLIRCDGFHRSAPNDGFMNVVRIKSLPSDPNRAQLVLARLRRNYAWADTLEIEFTINA